MKEFVDKHLIKIAMGIVGILILVGAGLSYYNRGVMEHALILQDQSKFAEQEVTRVYDNIKLMDVSARGYAIIREPSYLFWSIEAAQNAKRTVFHNLDSIFEKQGFQDSTYYPKVKKGLDDYTDMYIEMVGYLKNRDDSAYVKLLREDKGKYFWEVVNPFALGFNAFEKKITDDAKAQYDRAVFVNTILQFLLIIIAFPTLAFVAFRLNRDERNRRQLLMNLERNNRKFLFDDGSELNRDVKDILDNSIVNLQKAAGFVNEISVGNYGVVWDGLTDANKDKNTTNLAGRLIFMRDEMKKVKEDDSKRIWTTEGLSNFSEIIRQYQSNLEDLALKALTFIVKYSKSQQGSLFVLHDENGEDLHLKLVSCYAFDRKKIVEKRVNIGEGLLGQAFLEADTILLKNVPPGYIQITSGLGDAPPNCVIIVPLKHNEKVLALLELASFKVYQPHEVAFLEKAGEYIASAIWSAQGTVKTQQMMMKLKDQTEQLRSQEEELRQNLEELEATQEDMRRKQSQQQMV